MHLSNLSSVEIINAHQGIPNFTISESNYNPRGKSYFSNLKLILSIPRLKSTPAHCGGHPLRFEPLYDLNQDIELWNLFACCDQFFIF